MVLYKFCIIIIIITSASLVSYCIVFESHSDLGHCNKEEFFILQFG